MQNHFFFILLLAFASCSKNTFLVETDKRVLSSYENSNSDEIFSTDTLWYQDLVAKEKEIDGTLEFPRGVRGKEVADLWHLSEGSDFFPLKWIYHLESQTTQIVGTKFLEDLDKKFGVIRDDYSIDYGYPLKWIGLSSSWSNSDPRVSDVLVENGKDSVRFIKWKNKAPQIAMLGVNCAFCHTSEISYRYDENSTTHKKILEGAPGMVYMRGFFQDMMFSTIKTMLNVEKLTVFIDRNKNQKRGTSKKVAEDFVLNFKNDLGISSRGVKKLLGNIYKKINPDGFQDKATKAVKKAFFENKETTLKYLKKLMVLTYELKGNTVPTEVAYRLERVAILVGADPNLKSTTEGYSRTDAFGRIGNLVARLENPTELTATTSVPHMWGMKYKSMFHWNANTNSVMNRNIGQSFGLGSVLTNPTASGDEKFDSTSNLHNLARLEKLLYKLEVPNFRKLFPTHKIENKVSLQAGCNTFVNKCMSCHQSDSRVGPQDKLINDHIIKHEIINTDTWYTELQKAPVNGIAFKDALFSFVNKVKERYSSRYDVSKDEIESWQNTDLRGPEFFRDTFLGEESHQSKDSSYINISKENAGYPARSLAGIWATAPFLHNGSVANLRELLSPEEKRSKMFFVGNHRLDIKNIGYISTVDGLPGGRKSIESKYRKTLSEKTIISKSINGTYERDLIAFACKEFIGRCFNSSDKGNSNKGHSGSKFGTNLSENEKNDLINFIKYVNPHVEYSWRSAPLYRIKKEKNKNTCELY